MFSAEAGVNVRVAREGWRAGEVGGESNSGARKNRRDVDVDFVEEPRVQFGDSMSRWARASPGAPFCFGRGLGCVGARLGWSVMCRADEVGVGYPLGCWSPGVVSAPPSALSKVRQAEGMAAGEDWRPARYEAARLGGVDS